MTTTIKLTAHWASRIQHLEQARAKFQQNPAVLLYLRSEEEYRALVDLRLRDAGKDPAAVTSCKFATTKEGPVLEIEEKE